ncbi:MAG: DUF6502 family protein [Gammaproteobacteria bacterium]|nr:DUF6502 family protein [Gammaproteobacteria bacterium]MDH5802379.1 DUF6502 family protein [Gammaproteobacteria bacterium]
MADAASNALKALQHILNPLVKLLLRFGITYSAFSELAKKSYFEVAKTEFAIAGRKQTSSRISTLTGLSRKEVARLENLPPSDSLDTSKINRAARVISAWMRDKAYLNKDNSPADLPFEGDTSFSSLVKSYSGDITARTIADELIRVDAISTTATGLIHLNNRAYIANNNEIERLTILGSDVSDLIDTIDHNLKQIDSPRFQRKVSYNFIPEADLETLKHVLSERNQQYLESVDNLLAKYAIPKSNASKHKRYARIGIGIYYFEGKHNK